MKIPLILAKMLKSNIMSIRVRIATETRTRSTVVREIELDDDEPPPQPCCDVALVKKYTPQLRIVEQCIHIDKMWHVNKYDVEGRNVFFTLIKTVTVEYPRPLTF